LKPTRGDHNDFESGSTPVWYCHRLAEFVLERQRVGVRVRVARITKDGHVPPQADVQ
jgi:hypothetical protein